MNDSAQAKTSRGNRKRLRGWGVAAAAFTMLAAMALTAAPASANETAAPENEQEIRDILNKFSVPSADQSVLLQKVVDGVAWDVYLPDEVPVSATKEVLDGFDYDIKRYADGSVAAIGMEIGTEVPTGSFQPMSISQCTTTTGSGYTNKTGCQIDGWWGTVFVGVINVSYTLVQGAFDQITNTGYGFQKCAAPTNCTSPTRVLFKQTENSSGPAYARWQSDVSSSVGSWNVWLQLNVGGDAAFQTNS